MRLLGSKGEEVHWKDELCCEEKGSRRPGIQSSLKGREARKGNFPPESSTEERKVWRGRVGQLSPGRQDAWGADTPSRLPFPLAYPHSP